MNTSANWLISLSKVRNSFLTGLPSSKDDSCYAKSSFTSKPTHVPNLTSLPEVTLTTETNKKPFVCQTARDGWPSAVFSAKTRAPPSIHPSQCSWRWQGDAVEVTHYFPFELWGAGVMLPWQKGRGDTSVLHEFHNLVEYGAESVYSEYPVLDIGQSDPSFLIIFKILGLTSSTLQHNNNAVSLFLRLLYGWQGC